MATVLPPPSKRQKLARQAEDIEAAREAAIPEGLGNVRVQFVDQASGQTTGVPVSLAVSQASVKNLQLLLNSLQSQVDVNQTDVPYRFSFIDDNDSLKPSTEITSDVYTTLLKPGLRSTEDLITLQFTPQALFRVRAVTRCSASISGHGSAILSTHFSPVSSSRMVSGGGDRTARIWDCDTGTPFKTLEGHTSWVLVTVDAEKGQAKAGPLKGHTKWITAVAWEPYHLQSEDRPRFASSSKDASVRIWDATLGRTEVHFTRHKNTVSCVRWSGKGKVVSSSHDKTVMVWDPDTGALLQTLASHSHWVNHLALSTDFVLRTAFHDHEMPLLRSHKERRAFAAERFKKSCRISEQLTERLVTASDDCTIFLWDMESLSKPIARLLGHQKQVNHVVFSPDGYYIASAGFDNHVKLWQARDGKFLHTFRGHVGPVYQCSFSADSRLLVSASRDTTLKVWDVKTGTLVQDLPGHKDEVFTVDWSPDGRRVGSGGKDKLVRLWTQ